MVNTNPENLILLCGELITDGASVIMPNGAEYYEYQMKITLPDGADVLPVLIAKSQIDETVAKGETISIAGKLIAYASEEQVSLKVQASEVYAGETEITSGIFLTGTVIAQPYAYALETGERAEFHLSVGTENSERIRVPVACGSENVSVAKGLREGDTVSLLGQLHSYELLDLDGGSANTYTAYEVETLTFTNVTLA